MTMILEVLSFLWVGPERAKGRRATWRRIGSRETLLVPEVLVRV